MVDVGQLTIHTGFHTGLLVVLRLFGFHSVLTFFGKDRQQPLGYQVFDDARSSLLLQTATYSGRWRSLVGYAMFNDCQGETCTILIGHAGGMEWCFNWNLVSM